MYDRGYFRNQINKKRKIISDEELKTEEFYNSIRIENGFKSMEEYLEELDRFFNDLDDRVPLSIKQTTGKAEIDINNISRDAALSKYIDTLRSKNWSEKSIKNLIDSTGRIVNNLEVQETKETGAVKGLVVGNIQSGKTASIEGVMSFAADMGVNFIIILSGLVESLRQQTNFRIEDDIIQTGSNITFKMLKNPSRKLERDIGLSVSNLNLSSASRNCYVTVMLKNSRRLNDLYEWIKVNPLKQKQMKVLVIDDEADQASINTKDVSSEERTAINKIIRKIVNDKTFKSMNYVAYTATPFANVLNESGQDTLYPKDFIELLESSSDYIGLKQIFGLTDPQLVAEIGGISLIPNSEQEIMQEYQKNNVQSALPQSALKESIDWFLIALAALRSKNIYSSVSMLVHTSFKIAHHETIEKIIENYLLKIKRNYSTWLVEVKKFYFEKQKELSKEDFLKVMRGYSKNIDDYPKWDKIKNELDYIFERDDFYTLGVDENITDNIHICVDNSKTTDDLGESIRLNYPKNEYFKNNDKAPGYIVIGGNTLSRGLTLQGLVSTYFLRKTPQADTLMQMARWFGFRYGYEIFPRIWIDTETYRKFNFISQMNEEMRGVLAEYAAQGLTPMQVAPKIKQSPNYADIRITASNKMQSAEVKDFNFAGINTQTTVFKNDFHFLEENIETTRSFLQNLDTKPEKTGISKLVFRNISGKKIQEYICKYNSVNKDKKLSNFKNLANWISENTDNMENWNVAVIGNQSSKETWEVGEWKLGKVNRSQAKYSVGTENISIGALRSPIDLLADVKNLSDKEREESQIERLRNYRTKHGLSNVPLLLIYCIDKNSKPQKNSRSRVQLNAPTDIIGLNILIPGKSKNKNGEYIAINLKKKI